MKNERTRTVALLPSLIAIVAAWATNGRPHETLFAPAEGGGLRDHANAMMKVDLHRHLADTSAERLSRGVVTVAPLTSSAERIQQFQTLLRASHIERRQELQGLSWQTPFHRRRMRRLVPVALPGETQRYSVPREIGRRNDRLTG